MGVQHFMKPGYGPRRSCKITKVNTEKREIEGMLKDATIVQIAIFDSPGFFIWPKQGEYWTIHQYNGIWMLNNRMEPNYDGQLIKNLNEGEAKIDSDVIKTVSGKSVIAVDDSKATDDQIIFYKNNQWVVGNHEEYVIPYYGSFYSNVNQNADANNTGKVITYNNTDFNYGVSIINDSKITIENPGIYNIQFSLQFINIAASIYNSEVWFRKNGVDMPNSNTFFSVVNKHAGGNGHTLNAWNFFVNASAKDYYELVWATASSANVRIGVETSNSNGPAVPSVILTVNRVG